MTNREYIDYFKNLAVQHKKLKHTNAAIAFIDDPKEIPTPTLARTTLILFPQILSVKDEKSDNVFKYKTGEFWILKPCKKDNKNEQQDAIDECEQIGWDILQRLYEEAGKAQNQRPVMDFDLNTINGFPLGEQFNSCYGFAYTFTTGSPDYMDTDDPGAPAIENIWLDTP